MKKVVFKRYLNAMLMMVAMASSAFGAIKLPTIFADHMILQQDAKIPVWGTSDPNDEITVTFAGKTAKTTASAKGDWRVDLEKVEGNSTPQILSIQGKGGTVKFIDVLVGDIWICAGQNNMVLPLRESEGGKEEYAKANDNLLRFYTLTPKNSFELEGDIIGSWQSCNSSTAGPFSALGYYYGKGLRKLKNRPVGLIGVYWGLTTAQSWISISALDKVPELKKYADEFRKVKSEFDLKNADYPKKLEEYKAEYIKWNEEVGNPLRKALVQWQEDANAAKAAGKPIPEKPRASRPYPQKPEPPDGGKHVPTVLFNGTISPLIPFAIKGVVWYQGEANVSYGGEDYAALFPALIKDWREMWEQGDFPFLFVQLANYDEKPNNYNPEPWGPRGWPIFREAQAKALTLPNTGMATAIDLGDPASMVPKNKSFIAERLILAARKVAYEEDIVHSGPTYDSMKVEDGKIRITFKNVGKGIEMGAAPWSPKGDILVPGSELTGFTIAGADKKWVPAKARMDGNDVLVWSDDVSEPAAVRYAWENNPSGNLYNKDKLPAPPFRTDTWEP